MRRLSSITIPPTYWDDDDESFDDEDDHLNNEDNSNNPSYGSIGCGRNDILCGKDKTYSKHPGNRMFRKAIVAFRDLYAAARCKQDKMAITRAIVRRLQDECGARFVRFHDGTWQEITDIMARDKVSHALRFLLREGGGSGAGSASAGSAVEAEVATTTTMKRASSVPARATAVRRRTLLELPKRTFSFQPAVVESSLPASLRRNSSNHEDDDDESEDEAADAMRQCQLYIFQNLRMDDPLEHNIGGLDWNLQSIPIVGTNISSSNNRSSGPTTTQPWSYTATATAAV